MIKGSCLCGGIRFEIDEVRSLTHCHCSNCRKLSGAAFASYVHVDADKYRLLSGEGLMQQFESAPGSFRVFCRICGSTAPGKAPYLTTVSISADCSTMILACGLSCMCSPVLRRRGGRSQTGCRNTRNGCGASLRSCKRDVTSTLIFAAGSDRAPPHAKLELCSTPKDRSGSFASF